MNYTIKNENWGLKSGKGKKGAKKMGRIGPSPFSLCPHFSLLLTKIGLNDINFTNLDEQFYFHKKSLKGKIYRQG